MTWVRWDDQFPIHRKVSVLSDAAYRLHTEAICWCVRNGTDGLIAPDELGIISVRAKPKSVGELIRRDLWHPSEHGCSRCTQPTPGGHVIHDILIYQPSAARVAAEREAKAQRQTRWLEAKRRGRDASQDAAGDGSEDDAPLPPRPAPKGSGEGTSPQRPPTAAVRQAGTVGGQNHQPRNGVKKCLTCNNGVDSAYHRNVCIKIGARA